MKNGNGHEVEIIKQSRNHKTQFGTALLVKDGDEYQVGFVLCGETSSWFEWDFTWGNLAPAEKYFNEKYL